MSAITKNNESIKELRWMILTLDCPPEAKNALKEALKALEREQAILNSGYIGKEIDFHIGGRLFSFREKSTMINEKCKTCVYSEWDFVESYDGHVKWFCDGCTRDLEYGDGCEEYEECEQGFE